MIPDGPEAFSCLAVRTVWLGIREVECLLMADC